MYLEKTYQAAAAKPYAAARVEKEGKDGAEKTAKPGSVADKPVENWPNKQAKVKTPDKAPQAETGKADKWTVPAKTAMAENVVTAKMADYLTEKVPAALPGEDLVKAVIARLDSDGSGTLNSEEIAGTRLAEKIGAGFFELDGDKTGTLDKTELGSFVRSIVLGLAEKVAPAETAAPSATVAPVTAAPEAGAAIEAPDATVAVAETVEVADGEPSAAASASERVRLAFETALQMIRDGQETRSTYDVVSALYGTTRGILAA